GDLCEGHLGHVQLAGADETEQQVERALEIAQLQPETGAGLTVRRHRHIGVPRCLFGCCLVGWYLVESARRRRVGGRAHRPDRWMTSRAIARYASAPPDFGAQVVIGSPATLASGKRTVRAMA